MATDAEPELLEEAASRFLPQGHFSFSQTQGGVNNVVRRVACDDGSSYVLRVYNNGNNSAKVLFEHTILEQLSKMNLSIRIPTALRSLDVGMTHVLLSNGAEASMFQVIPGVLPKLTMVKEIGRASGELFAAMGTLKVDLEPPTPPYFELFRVHHAVTRELFFSAIDSKEFDCCRGSIAELAKEIHSLESQIAELREHNLPMQLIHGDLHYDNVLVADGQVSGLLDFEFCALDWRAMELAI